MRFSSALISFLSSLSTTSVTMAMEEPHDSVLYDVTESILEESIEVKYKSKKSRLEPLKIQNSNDGRPNKANAVELADDKGDIMQKKELIHHLVDHQEHQEGKSLEECNISSTTTAATATATATATSDDDDSLMKRKISLDRESIKKMDYGHLNRGTCSSPNDACVPQNKAIEGNGAYLEPEDASYASIGYCVPLSVLEGMEYKNGVTTTMSLIDNEEFNKEEEMTDSYYHYHPQYDQHHRQLDSLDCASLCPDPRQDVSSYEGPFASLTNCYVNGDCTSDYPDISCWNTAGITDMNYAFSGNPFNDPLKCWDVGLVTAMDRMFNSAVSFNQPLDTWNVSQVEDMSDMFNNARRFNQSIDSWDVSQVENMDEMFFSAISFNQPLDSWNVSQVDDMSGMFSRATSFNQPIDTWDVSQVYYMTIMFFEATSFNQCLSTWAEKTSGYVDTNYLLYGTDCPNEYATIGPWCQDNTQGCFAPGFGTPTGAPTGTKNHNECNNVNESDFSFKGKSCSKYLKKKTGKKCKKIIDGVLVADSCPSLCKRFCPPCKNKSGKIKLENGKRFNCKKIKKKKKCNSITKSGALAKEICPVACKFEGC